jgi:hypothetical protein
VDDFPEGVVIELVGPAGETLDLLDLPLSSVRVIERCGETHAVGA